MKKHILYFTLCVVAACNIFAAEDISLSLEQIKINLKGINFHDVEALPSDQSGKYFNYNFAFPQSDLPKLRAEIVSSRPDTILYHKFTAFESDRHNYKLLKIGTVQGVDIYSFRIYPLVLSNGQFRQVETENITISYPHGMSICTVSDSFHLTGGFDVINSAHFSAIKNYSDSLSKAVSFAKIGEPKGAAWYNPDLTYYAISTRQDAPTFIKLSDLLALSPELSGLPAEHLLLYNCGISQPYYIGNSIISASDTLFFTGSRNKGDTTYYDNYATDATFYLTYDPATTAIHFTPSAEYLAPPASAKVEKVFSRRHFERDSLYADGINLEYSFTVPGEGWYYKPLNPTRDSVINFHKIVFPFPGEVQTVEAGLFATKVNPKLVFNHRIEADINSLQANALSFPYLQYDYYKTHATLAPADNFVFGMNNFTFRSLGFPEYGDSVLYLDGLGFDYFEISGYSLPIAAGGKADFYVDTLRENSTLTVYPFLDPNVIAFDTLNNYKLSGFARPGDCLSVNTSSKGNSKTIFSLNHAVAAESDQKGFHLLVFSPDSRRTEYFFFDNITKFIAKYTSFETSKTLLLAINPAVLSSGDLILLRSINLNFDSYASGGITAIKPAGEINFAQSDNSSGNAKNIIFIDHPNGELYSYTVNLPAGKDYHIIASDNQNLQAESLIRVPGSDLKNPNIQSNVLVITPRAFAAEAEKYIAYRSATHKDYSFRTIFTEDIYKEFGFGRVSPNAIKDFLRYAYKNWPNSRRLKTVVLLGDACIDARGIFPYTKMTDYIPSFGNPVSDNWYSWLDDPTPITEIGTNGNVEIIGYKDDILPDILLSRIPVKNSVDMDNYLGKMQAFDNLSPAPWKNSILYLTGGISQYEIIEFYYSYTYTMSNIITRSLTCTTGENITKSQEGSSDNSDGIKVINALNSGKIMTFFAGHGSPVVFDLDGWTPNNLSNTGKYGLFYTQSCNTGAFALPEQNSRFEDYLLTKDKGFAFCIGASATENIHEANTVARNFANAVFNDKHRNIVEAYNFAKSKAYEAALNSPYENEMFLIQYRGTTLGDPFLSIPIDTVAELYLLPEELSAANSAGQTQITDDDQFAVINFTARNFGTRDYDEVNVSIIDTYDNSTDKYDIVLHSVCPAEKYEFKLPIAGKTGSHTLSITLDPDNKIYEHRKDNNTLTVQFDVLRNLLMPVEPLAHYDVPAVNPQFRLISVLKGDSANYTLEIHNYDQSEPLYASTPEELKIEDNVVDWQPKISLPADANFYLKAYYELSGSDSVSPLNFIKIPFHTASHDISRKVSHLVSETALNDIRTENLKYEDKGLVFAHDSVEFELIGINGISDDEYTVNRGAFMTLDGKYVLSIPKDLVGFHLVHYDKEFSNFRHRYYNTWGVTSDGNSRTDSASINMVKYLRDSVGTDDNIFLATMGQSFRLFSLHNRWHTEGSWDTLKTVLEKFGAKLTRDIDAFDKKDNAWGISYAFASQVSGGEPKAAFEGLSLTGDTAFVSGKLPRYFSHGVAEFYLDNLDSLYSVELIGDNLSDQIESNVSIYGINSDAPDYKLLIESAGAGKILLPDSLPEYSKYKILYQFNKTGHEPYSFAVKSLNAEYLPRAEYGIFKLHELSDSIYAGDLDTLSVKLRNLSLRREIDTLKLLSVVTDGTAEIARYSDNFYNLTPNSAEISENNLITDEYPNKISVQTKVEKSNYNDLYSFNNALEYNQNFMIDSLKPEIHLELDGYEVANGSNIPIRPRVRAYFKDNSPRIISDPNNLRVRINTLYATSDNTTDYVFLAHQKFDTIKAELTFLPDSLDFDENIIRVYAEDANSNRDTAYFSLNVSRLGAITHISIFPNPLEVSSTIEFDYMAPGLGGYSQIEIFNYAGQLINSYKMSLHIGRNQIPLFITDQNNAPLPSGIYYYRVSIHGTEVSVEPISDKFIISR